MLGKTSCLSSLWVFTYLLIIAADLGIKPEFANLHKIFYLILKTHLSGKTEILTPILLSNHVKKWLGMFRDLFLFYKV